MLLCLRAALGSCLPCSRASSAIKWALVCSGLMTASMQPCLPLAAKGRAKDAWKLLLLLLLPSELWEPCEDV